MNVDNTQAFLSELHQACETMGVILTDLQQHALYQYWCLFIKWNSTYNLSAIRDPEQILYKHIIDSLALWSEFKVSAFERILDVGTGGGLPGIPLAICFPEKSFTLIDSAGKKIRFLFQVKQSLGLNNVILENTRVETLKVSPFDMITSRAFATLKKFTTLTTHLLAENGEFWAMKAIPDTQELSEIEKHYKVCDQLRLQVPGVDGQRCLIKIKPLSSNITL